ncbi:MAG: 50S ribosomal protein L19 [Candidatus Omnitrophica bacterium]|nr:50S ribosomal protein L19 [Candidatus Omnitrophota bacterium]
MANVALEKFERGHMRSEVPEFRVGDTVRVNFRVREGDRERIQGFEGICTRRSGGGHSEMVTVRKISSGIGVERMFYLHSPLVESIKLVRKGHVRRSRLYYLRERFGKAARVKGSKKFLAPRGAVTAETVEEAPAAEE